MKKRILAILLCGTLVLSLLSCGSKASLDDPATPAVPESDATATPDNPEGNPIAFRAMYSGECSSYRLNEPYVDVICGVDEEFPYRDSGYLDASLEKSVRPSPAQILDLYDEAFFEDHVLLVFSSPRCGSPSCFPVNEVLLVQDEVHVQVNCTYGYNEDDICYFIFVELPKEIGITSVEQMNVEFTDKQLSQEEMRILTNEQTQAYFDRTES